MKRQLIGVLTGLAFAGTMVLAQSATAQNPTTSQAKVPDVTLTGCLIQGTSPDTFVLDNARTAMQSKTDKGQSYFLVAGTEDLGFAHEVNHEVTVTGAADQTAVVTPPPAGQKTAERDLPKLSAKSLTMVSIDVTRPAADEGHEPDRRGRAAMAGAHRPATACPSVVAVRSRGLA